VEGLHSNGVEVDVLYVRDWIPQVTTARPRADVDCTLLDVPSRLQLLKHSLSHGGFGKILKDISNRTKLHQSLDLLGKQVSDFVKARGYDLIHAHGIAASALLADASNFAPYTVSAWGSDIYIMPSKYPYIQRLMARALAHAALIHVESTVSANRILQIAPRVKDKIYISTWGVDTDLFVPQSLSTKEKEKVGIPKGRVILSFRALQPLYRVDTIIRAFAALPETAQDAVLVIGSDGLQRDALEGLSENLGIEEKVIFTGYVNQDKKRALFSNAYLYVQFPESDGVALSMMEAMSSALPVVSSDVGETSILIKDGYNGFLVKDSTPEGLSKAMNRILDDQELRNTMGMHSREMAIEDHSRAKFFRSFVKAVKHAVESYD
jgi:glycosyltransferase involved in cell wall biosynthesis